MTDCLFCKIAAKEISSSVVYEDDLILAFKDINSVSPFHILIITKEHYRNILDVPDEKLINIMKAIKKIAKEYNLDESGFRIVNNCGNDGGQEVDHIHFHMLAKRSHSWPPG
ncbi:MAG: histidine triad nucleotide-binding protein [Candidatus Margulisbacteria bacterium GWF2_35_9]|nr:MAG: histidine triad nucleotide-binding protein [Candidatus Margulisbacteria bacterium GWF2_35_9]